MKWIVFCGVEVLFYASKNDIHCLSTLLYYMASLQDKSKVELMHTVKSLLSSTANLSISMLEADAML